MTSKAPYKVCFFCKKKIDPLAKHWTNVPVISDVVANVCARCHMQWLDEKC